MRLKLGERISNCCGAYYFNVKSIGGFNSTNKGLDTLICSKKVFPGVKSRLLPEKETTSGKAGWSYAFIPMGNMIAIVKRRGV